MLSYCTYYVKIIDFLCVSEFLEITTITGKCKIQSTQNYACKQHTRRCKVYITITSKCAACSVHMIVPYTI